MPPYGEKRTHHIHLMETSNNTIEQQILFRDILRRDEKVRQQYESLKIALSQSLTNDRESYTDQKGAFIEAALRGQGYTKSIDK